MRALVFFCWVFLGFQLFHWEDWTRSSGGRKKNATSCSFIFSFGRFFLFSGLVRGDVGICNLVKAQSFNEALPRQLLFWLHVEVAIRGGGFQITFKE